MRRTEKTQERVTQASEQETRQREDRAKDNKDKTRGYKYGGTDKRQLSRLADIAAQLNTATTLIGSTARPARPGQSALKPHDRD